jgi:hypothetical protein
LLRKSTYIGQLFTVLDKRQCPSLNNEERIAAAETIISTQPTWEQFGGDSAQLWRVPHRVEYVAIDINLCFISFNVVGINMCVRACART